MIWSLRVKQHQIWILSSSEESGSGEPNYSTYEDYETQEMRSYEDWGDDNKEIIEDAWGDIGGDDEGENCQ